MRKRWLETLNKLAVADSRLVFVGSDLTNDSGMQKYRREVPNRFFMEGISEAHLAGLSGGMASSGKIVYFNTIATFITRRCFEQNVIDLGLVNANVRLIGNGGGLVYAPLGPTHLAIEDIAIMSAIPNMTVIAPVDADEMERAIEASVAHKGPIYFRVGKGGDPILSRPEHGFKIGKAIVHRDPGRALILSTGIMLQYALQAATDLAAYGISVGVVHVHTVKPLDEPLLQQVMQKSEVVVTVEEHLKRGGLGSAVAELVAERAELRHLRFRRMGLPDAFPDLYGSQIQLLAKYGLAAKDIERTVHELLDA